MGAENDAPDLFGHTPEHAGLPKRVKGAARKTVLTPLQREFQGLIKKVEQEQALLEEWRRQPEILLGLVQTEFMPAEAELNVVRREFAMALDALLTSPPKGLRMTARRRDGLTEALLMFADMVLEDGDDPELQALCDRYAPEGLDDPDDEDEGEDEEIEADILELLDDIIGPGSIERGEDEDIEAFAARAQARLQSHFDEVHQQEAERARQEKPRRKGRKGKVGNTGKAESEVPSGDPLRDLYRKLASSLHPDRELDPDEKVRKTRAMQSLNEAYRSKDLLTLMKYQAEHLGDGAVEVNDAMLRDYIHALKTQLDAVKLAVGDARDAAIPPMVVMQHGPLTRPAQVVGILKSDIEKARRVTAELRRGLSALADPARRKQEIDALVEAMEERADEDAFDEAFFDMLVR